MVGQCVNIYHMEVLNGYKFDIMSISDKSAIGSILEVDLEYPDELHNELYNDFPLAPNIFVVSNDMLLNYCKNIADKYEIKVGDVKKINSKFR